MCSKIKNLVTKFVLSKVWGLKVLIYQIWVPKLHFSLLKIVEFKSILKLVLLSIFSIKNKKHGEMLLLHQILASQNPKNQTQWRQNLFPILLKPRPSFINYNNSGYHSIENRVLLNNRRVYCEISYDVLESVG